MCRLPAPSTIRRILHQAGLITPAAAQTAPIVLHALRDGAAERDVAVGLHPLAARPTAPTSRSSTGSMTTPATCSPAPFMSPSAAMTSCAVFLDLIEEYGPPASDADR